MSSFCPDCGTPLKPEWKICTNCGKQLAQTAPTARQCIQCGTIKQGDVAFCPNCGGQMVEFVQKPTGAKAANKKKRLVYGGVTAGIAFFTFLSFFLPYASNGFGMTISASKLMGTSFAEETFLLIAFLLSIVTLLCAAGAIFKRKLSIAHSADRLAQRLPCFRLHSPPPDLDCDLYRFHRGAEGDQIEKSLTNLSKQPEKLCFSGCFSIYFRRMNS